MTFLQNLKAVLTSLYNIADLMMNGKRRRIEYETEIQLAARVRARKERQAEIVENRKRQRKLFEERRKQKPKE